MMELGPGSVFHQPASGAHRTARHRTTFQEGRPTRSGSRCARSSSHSFSLDPSPAPQRARGRIHEAISTHRPPPGRPRPVLVDLPQDSRAAEIDYDAGHRRAPAARLPAARSRATKKQIRHAGEGAFCFFSAGLRKRPVSTGRRRPFPTPTRPNEPERIRHDPDRFSGQLCTLMGFGWLSPPRTRSGLGMLGMHGNSRRPTYAWTKADRICAVPGARPFDDRSHRQLSEFRAPRARKFHPHRRPTRRRIFSKERPPRTSRASASHATLPPRKLLDRVPRDRPPTPTAFAPWWSRI